MANIGEQHEGKTPDAEGAKKEGKQSPLERLDAITKEALGGTRAARSEATDAIKARVAGVESVGGTAADKAALETRVAPGLAEIDAAATGAEAQIKATAAKSPDELAEEVMSPAQKEMSNEQARRIQEDGIRLISGPGMKEPSADDLRRWPDAEGLHDLSGQLPDGRKIDLRVVITKADRDGAKARHGGWMKMRELNAEQFSGTVNGKEISPEEAKQLFIDQDSGVEYANVHYDNATEQANARVGSENPEAGV